MKKIIFKNEKNNSRRSFCFDIFFITRFDARFMGTPLRQVQEAEKKSVWKLLFSFSQTYIMRIVANNIHIFHVSRRNGNYYNQ